MTGRIKVLAIIGDSTGIDTQEDLKLLKKLPNIQLRFLVEPQRQELEEPFWNEGWDILFFAGHSSQSKSGAGVFGINKNESLTINDLRYALERAVAHGLKLAILNSCDGIGLAKDLAELGIPQILVMREQVPDRVAQAFLKNFLTAFAKENKPFYLACREAREKLKGLENVYPYASWLPAVFQNPAIGKFYWHTLSGIRQEKGLLGNFKRKLLATSLVSTVVTTSVMGIRSAGWLQPIELQAFDRLLLLRPDEKPDSRLLVVTITEKDLNLPEQRGARGSLSDLALEKLLQKLERYDPRLIVLDIYRNFPVDSKRQVLASHLRQNDRFISVCKASDPEFDPDGIAPPPEVPQERLGFSDSITDPDGTIRRHLLAGTPPAASACATPYALSMLSAAHYLARQGILLEYTQEGFIKLGDVIFRPLETRAESYQNNVDTSGNQIVLNYRRVNGSLEKIAEKMTVSQVLRGPINPVFIKDRIVLIGATANSSQDDWKTPYSYQSDFQELAGVMVQAQEISQILSAVLDRRALLYSWSVWADVMWIFSWSALGGILVVKLRSTLYLVLGLVVAQSSLIGISFILLYCGCWVALVPSTIGLAICSGGLTLIKQIDKDGQKSNFLQNSISS